MINFKKIVRSVVRTYPKLIVIQIYPTDKYCKANGIDTYMNTSYCTGHIKNKANIFIGIYNDEELKILSFFHELAHVIGRPDDFATKYLNEKYTWALSYELAKQYNINFSKKAKRWARIALSTYKSHGQ